MTTNPLRHALIALHTVLGTWDRYPYGVHYCAMCDALYSAAPAQIPAPAAPARPGFRRGRPSDPETRTTSVIRPRAQ
jgi:hypothetical protein